MSNNRKIVIIGGVAGGATAAARARRADENASITVIEKGAYVSFANCGLPYYIAGDIKDRNKLLLQTPTGFLDRYRIDVMIRAEAKEIDVERKIVHVEREGKKIEVPYDTLILSQGGAPFVPPVKGLPASNVFTLRNMDDMDRMNNFIKEKKPKTAVIAGGGFIGLEMAEALVHRGLEVTVVEKLPQILPNLDPEFAAMAKEELEANKVRVINNQALSGVGSDRVELEDGTSIPAEFVLFSAGIRPELELAKRAGLVIGETGAISVNSRMQTSNPDIFAVGDMAEITSVILGKKVRIPLAGPANRQARIAGSNAAGMRMNYRGSLGTAIVKIFRGSVASTGLSEKAARQAGLDAASITVHAKNHASYYPGSSDITLKIIYLKSNRKVLGAEAWGREGVDKRIDVIATALAGNLTMDDLEDLDLAYAPPYSSANDPINVAAFMALNDQTGFSPMVSPSEFASKTSHYKEDFLLDVRDPSEYASGHLPGSVNIPLNSLRERLGELPRDRSIVVYCQVGRRGHLAARILSQNGFRAVNIGGGYQSLKYEVA